MDVDVQARAATAVTAMDRMMRSRAVPFVTAVAVHAAGATDGVCPTLTAGTGQSPHDPCTKGTSDDVKVDDYACVKADGSIKKLATHKVDSGIPTTVKGGPRGWTCTSSKSKAALASTGRCSQKFPSVAGTFFARPVG